MSLHDEFVTGRERSIPFAPHPSASNFNSPSAPPQIQRQTACSCGGDCPRCRGATLQTKLSISHAGDRHEREADQIAEQVMRMPALSADRATPLSLQQEPTARLQRKCGECEEEEQKTLSRKEDSLAHVQSPTPISSLVSQTLASQGQPLDAATRSFFEPRFGRDFGGVRIHSDASAAESAQSVNAQAYTVGRDVVFGKEKYRPESDEGKHLLAHELAHVVQQGRHGARMQRKDKPQPADDKAKKAGDTAADAPTLALDKLATGTACACLIVIHNNEQNARRTAQAMRKHCSYNLLLRTPDDDKARRIHLPGQPAKSDVDPNELFPPEIAKECLKDEQSCRDFVKDNAGSKKAATVKEVVEKQFFLAVKDCSQSFSLPVVGLHNNTIEDSEKYLDKVKSGTKVSGLKLDIDKTDPAVGEKKVKELKDLLDKTLGTEKVNTVKSKVKDKKTGKEETVEKKYSIREYMTELPGKTNIFRWCSSNALNKCHIGDPEHPDNVVWVTNDKDFDALSKKDVNVALQNDLSKALGTDAETDLSTVFLVIKKVKGELLNQKTVDLTKAIDEDIKDIKAIVAELQSMAEYGDITLKNLIDRVLRLLVDFIDLLIKNKQLIDTSTAIAGLDNLRFINIETQEKFPGKKQEDVRVESYDTIINVLKAVGLHCCGDAAATATAEKGIKEELKTE